MKQSAFMYKNRNISKRNKTSHVFTYGLSVESNEGGVLFISPLDEKGNKRNMQTALPYVDASLLVDAIDDVTGCVTEFAEALADIAYEAGAAGFRLADSRATIPLFIQWAKEFCQINVGREWDGEYLEEIQAFTEAKMAPEIPDDDFIAKF